MFDKPVVGKNASLGKTMHTFPDFDKQVAIVEEVGKFVLINSAARDVFHWNAHAFLMVHWHVEVKVFNIDCHEFEIWGGDDAIEECLDGCQVGC
jgi:hypothetical protein